MSGDNHQQAIAAGEDDLHEDRPSAVTSIVQAIIGFAGLFPLETLCRPPFIKEFDSDFAWRGAFAELFEHNDFFFSTLGAAVGLSVRGAVFWTLATIFPLLLFLELRRWREGRALLADPVKGPLAMLLAIPAWFVIIGISWTSANESTGALQRAGARVSAPMGFLFIAYTANQAMVLWMWAVWRFHL